MTAFELSEKISDLHLRKSDLVQETKVLQSELHGMEDSAARKAKVKVLNAAMGELAGINEKIKAYNVLMRSTKDQAMLSLIKKEYQHIYSRVETLVTS